ncbi:hypothetical protein D3C71_1846150 [compost metagenome]
MSSAASKYQELTWRICSAAGCESICRALLASCQSGRAISRDSHQMHSRVNSDTGRLLPRISSISPCSLARVASVERCATMPQPVLVTDA